MENSKKFGIAAAVLGGATLCLVMAQVADSAVATIRATTETPTFVLNSEKNQFWDATVGTASGTSHIVSEAGTSVPVEFSSFVVRKTTGNWHGIAEDGYFGNTERITGLTSLSFTLANSATVSVSWSKDATTFDSADTETFTGDANSSHTCSFGGDSPNFFKFSNSGTGNATIKSIDINFACVNSYPTITVESEDEAKGSVSGGGVYSIGSSVNLEATPSTGYSFAGWYEGNELLSTDNPFAYAVPSYDAGIQGRFVPANYDVVAQSEDESKGTVSGSGSYAYQSEVAVTATPLEGYSFAGWYDGSTLVSELAEYSFVMPYNAVSLVARFSPIAYTVELANENEAAGTISGNGTYDYKANVTLIASANAGYSFVGWHEGEILVSSESTYGFTMPARNLSYSARWSINNYEVSLSAEYVGTDGATEYGSVSGEGSYAYQSKQTVVATPAEGFAFLGWYDGTTLVSEQTEYTFTIPANNVALTAKFSKKYAVTLESYDPTWSYKDWGAPTLVGAGEYGYTQSVTVDFAFPYAVKAVYNSYVETLAGKGPYTFNMPEGNLHLILEATHASGTSVEFGSYPQTCVTDSSLISTLSAIEDTDNDSYIEYGGKEYLKTLGSGIANKWDSESLSYVVLYDTSTTYYFEVEPITWKYYDGLLICEKIIDASVYYTSKSYHSYDGGTARPNNYMYSTVRAYLNGYNGSNYEVDNFSNIGFIDKAFTADEQGMIATTTVDNSAATNNAFVSTACADTEDKIFLLSYQDARNADYGFSTNYEDRDAARMKEYTDYALYRGLPAEVGHWWLRSPGSDGSDSAWYVGGDGDVYNKYVTRCLGLSPALKLGI